MTQKMMAHRRSMLAKIREKEIEKQAEEWKQTLEKTRKKTFGDLSFESIFRINKLERRSNELQRAKPDADVNSTSKIVRRFCFSAEALRRCELSYLTPRTIDSHENSSQDHARFWKA